MSTALGSDCSVINEPDLNVSGTLSQTIDKNSPRLEQNSSAEITRNRQSTLQRHRHFPWWNFPPPAERTQKFKNSQSVIVMKLYWLEKPHNSIINNFYPKGFNEIKSLGNILVRFYYPPLWFDLRYKILIEQSGENFHVLRPDFQIGKKLSRVETLWRNQ